MGELAERVLNRTPADPSVMILDGFGLTLKVHRGHMVAEDGYGTTRRSRTLYRAERNVRRIIILGTTGSISIAALRWCADVGIAVIVLDPSEGRILSVGTPTTHFDARLRRAQAMAGVGDVGLQVARDLIRTKLEGQADVARTMLADAEAVEQINKQLSQLDSTGTVEQILNVEANAAQAYFKSWTGTPIRFGKADAQRVPPGWLRYTQRSSILTDRHSPKRATDPINALLNYCYTLCEIEAALACHTLGLDPGLGVLHRDTQTRNSMALDLIEPVRPAVDWYVLELLASHTFTVSDFTETRTGQCRLLAPLAHDLAETMPQWAKLLAPMTEQAAHAFLGEMEGIARRRTPLTGRPKTAPRKPARSTATTQISRPRPTCPDCGGLLGDKRRIRCPQCTDANRLNLTRERVAAQRQLIDDLETSKITGVKHRRQLGAARSSLSRLLADLWDLENPAGPRDPALFASRILPGLEATPVSLIRVALGVGNDAAWRIRKGTLTPHPRHWAALEKLGYGGNLVKHGR